MKRSLALSGRLASLATLLFAAGCASGTRSPETTPPAPTAPTTASPTPAASTSAAPPSTSDAGGASDATTPAAAAAADACGGADTNLTEVLANRRCRPDRDAPATPPSAAKDVKVTLTPSATKVAPGGHVDLDLELTNTGAAPIPLYFSGDLTLGPSVKDAKGARVSPPAGNAPKSSNPKCREVDCRLPSSHLTLPPGGKAHARVGWDAVKTAWPKVAPAGCCEFHVDAVAAGPLAAGTYKVRVVLPYETQQGNPSDPEIEIHVAK